jgi:hypothetical protein
MVGLVSAAGLVGFLSEPDPELKVFALKTLDSQIDHLWTEVVNSVPEMYVLPLTDLGENELHLLLRHSSRVRPATRALLTINLVRLSTKMNHFRNAASRH